MYKILLIFLISVIVSFFLFSIYKTNRVKGYINKLNYNRNKNRNKNKIKKILERSNIISLPEIKGTKEIPKIIFQTHKKKELIPDYYIKNLKNLNKDWDYRFFDNQDAKKFLREEFGKEFEDKFDSFERGAHKADLWRLCVLYKYGGCYLDADISMFVPFNEIIKNCSEKLIIPNTVVGLRGKRLFNAMIICKPGDEIIGECIKRIMLLDTKNLKKNYHYIIYLMEEVVKEKIKHEILEIHKPNSYFYFSSKPENHYMYLKGKKIAKSKRNDFL